MTTAASTAGPAAAGSGHQLRRDVGRLGLLFTGVGSIIGSGWLLGAFTASQLAGPAALLSWVIGGVMIMLIGMVYAELGAMYPISGGVVRYPHLTHGGMTSYSMGWVTWLAAMTVAPIEVEGALQYATIYWPVFTHEVGGTPVLTGWGYVAAAILMALFSLVNIVGVRLFARINTPIVWWKLGIIVLVVVTFLATSLHPHNFTSHGFAPSGTHGMFEAVATAGIVFSFLGFRQGVELAGEARNPQKAVPFAVIGSVGITMLIYVALQAAFILGLLPDQLGGGWAHLGYKNDFGPLAGLASILGLTWLAVLLYADAFISPADTGLIYTTVTARISYAMGRNGNAPEHLARINRNGVPWISVIVTFFAGLVIFAPFPGWQKLVGFITSATVLSFASGPVVLSSLRRQLPDVRRPFRLPAADLISYLAFFSSNMIVYWSGWNTDFKLFAAVGIGLVIYAIWRAFTRRIDHPAFDWKSFSWVMPWLGSLALISYLGSYDGGRGVITFAIAWPLIAVFSLVIFVWAVAVRLPADRVREHLAAMEHEHADETAYPDEAGTSAATGEQRATPRTT